LNYFATTHIGTVVISTVIE